MIRRKIYLNTFYYTILQDSFDDKEKSGSDERTVAVHYRTSGFLVYLSFESLYEVKLITQMSLFTF